LLPDSSYSLSYSSAGHSTILVDSRSLIRGVLHSPLRVCIRSAHSSTRATPDDREIRPAGEPRLVGVGVNASHSAWV
jgi:hypothetical protein